MMNRNLAEQGRPACALRQGQGIVERTTDFEREILIHNKSR